MSVAFYKKVDSTSAVVWFISVISNIIATISIFNSKKMYLIVIVLYIGTTRLEVLLAGITGSQTIAQASLFYSLKHRSLKI